MSRVHFIIINWETKKKKNFHSINKQTNTHRHWFSTYKNKVLHHSMIIKQKPMINASIVSWKFFCFVSGVHTHTQTSSSSSSSTNHLHLNHFFFFFEILPFYCLFYIAFCGVCLIKSTICFNSFIITFL